MNDWIWWLITLALPCLAIITYWWIARRQVRAATSELHEALAYERRIVAQVSHRIRDPLTVIYGFSEALVDASTLADPDDVATIAATVNAEALDVAHAVEDLVVAQEVDQGDLAIRSVGFDPLDEIERVATPFRRLGSPISVEAWSGTATSDPLRFRHVLQTLVSNAVRHGGSEITIFADVDGDWYRCTVADDGTGLPEATAERLFGAHPGVPPTSAQDDAHTLDERKPGHTPAPALVIDPDRDDGLGLGLAVAIRITQLLGGALTYERAPGLTAFTVSLPTEAWPGPLVPILPVSTQTDTPADGVESTDDDAPEETQEPSPSTPWPTVSFSGDDTAYHHGVDTGDDHAEDDVDNERSDEGVVPS